MAGRSAYRVKVGSPLHEGHLPRFTVLADCPPSRTKASFHRRHTILVIAWHIISTPRLTYEELGGDFFARRLIDQLEALGLKVSIQPAAV